MTFRFSLESLLRLRRGEQRQQEQVLQRINEQVSRIVRELHAIHLESLQTRRREPGLTGAELHFNEQRLAILESRRARAEMELCQARERQSFALAEFERIWQRREALETLQQRERQICLQQEQRREQRGQDDAFLQRKWKR